jgi:TonB-linked SusC/RagA family outer membrane protein
MKHLRRIIAVLIAAALAPVALLAQDAATVTGRVTSAQGQPEAAVLVRIESLNVGASTGADGSYRLVVPGARIRAGQSVQITAARQGLGTVARSLTLSPGANLTQNFQMAATAIILEDLVVTGTAGATERAKVPFSVAQVSAEQLQQVPATSAASAIQGKVAGAQVVSGSGRPGAAPSILLRGPKSLDASGRSQEPLYIVDGVVLSGSMVDIDALDIEEIEVVKGAAGASLYGSRAANGVIQIRTRRGTGMSGNSVRYTARSEFGTSELGRQPELLLLGHHPYALTDNGLFIDATSGEPCELRDCSSPRLAGQTANGSTASAWNSFAVNEWPGQTYNHLDTFFQNGAFMNNYLSAEGRSGETNFHVSFGNLNQGGVLIGQDGFRRNNFRVNVDQNVRSNVQVAASAFYSRASTDELPEDAGNPVFDLTRMTAGINLAACEDDPAQSCLNDPQRLEIQPDPFNVESPNPLYDLLVRERETDRGRFLGSANLTYSPLSWLDVDFNASYDRQDEEYTDYVPKGYRTPTASATLNNGLLIRRNQLDEAFNGSVTGTMRFQLGRSVANRTQLRYLYERQENLFTTNSGYDFQVGETPQFQNLNPDNLAATSGSFPVRADGYFAITNFDIRDRYIIDALIRNDGSSLFGEDERRQWYYRLAGAWRVSEEPWFNAGPLSDLKFRYSYGTAGGRPRFTAQYETFSVAGGVVSPVTLGNTELKPEFSREQEVGVDAGLLNDRLTLALTYANTVTEDQILRVPLAAFTGYQAQWRNAGTLKSNTWEASLDANLLERDNLSWSARLLFDRTRSRISELNVPAYTYGITGQELAAVFYAREGESVGTFYGTQVATSCEQLPVDRQPSCATDFAVNDEGLLVWVGPGGSLDDPQWGTQADFTLGGGGVFWGSPIKGQCADRATGAAVYYCPVGDVQPDYSLSFSSTLNWGGFSVYGLLDAVQGISVYNQPLQWAIFANSAGLYDQSDVAEADRKPMGYIAQQYAVSGIGPSSLFVEDGSFVKLRELAFRYHFGESTLGRLPGISQLSGLTLSLLGRNLHTWTDYRGFDPEVGKADGETGSAALGRIEGYQYPNFRTWTLGVEVNF